MHGVLGELFDEIGWVGVLVVGLPNATPAV
jgi:hypothetical protein